MSDNACWYVLQWCHRMCYHGMCNRFNAIVEPRWRALHNRSLQYVLVLMVFLWNRADDRRAQRWSLTRTYSSHVTSPQCVFFRISSVSVARPSWWLTSRFWGAGSRLQRRGRWTDRSPRCWYRTRAGAELLLPPSNATKHELYSSTIINATIDINNFINSVSGIDGINGITGIDGIDGTTMEILYRIHCLKGVGSNSRQRHGDKADVRKAMTHV